MSIQRKKQDSGLFGNSTPEPDTLPLLASDPDSVEIAPDNTKQSAAGAALTIVKACVGAGSFGLPHAFTQSGFWGGVVGIIILGILSLYTMHMLSGIVKKVGLSNKRDLSYVDIAQASLGRWASVIIYAGICLCSLGICGAYLIFCSSLLNEMVPAVPTWAWRLIMAGALTPLTYLRSYKYLAFTSILGDIAVVIGVVTVVAFGFANFSIGKFVLYSPHVNIWFWFLTQIRPAVLWIQPSTLPSSGPPILTSSETSLSFSAYIWLSHLSNSRWLSHLSSLRPSTSPWRSSRCST
jgi:hypothetical protein